jgi:hypothetical protein
MALISQPDLHQDCLDKLSRVLDLVLKTAEAASAGNNHKLVIQSAREVTRITALIHKMTNAKIKAAPARRANRVNALATGHLPPTIKAAAAPAAAAKEAFLELIGRHPADSGLPDLKQFFTPEDMVFWDTAPDHVLQDFGDKYQKWLNLEKAAIAELEALEKEAGAAG